MTPVQTTQTVKSEVDTGAQAASCCRALVGQPQSLKQLALASTAHALHGMMNIGAQAVSSGSSQRGTSGILKTMHGQKRKIVELEIEVKKKKLAIAKKEVEYCNLQLKNASQD